MVTRDSDTYIRNDSPHMINVKFPDEYTIYQTNGVAVLSINRTGWGGDPIKAVNLIKSLSRDNTTLLYDNNKIITFNHENNECTAHNKEYQGLTLSIRIHFLRLKMMENPPLPVLDGLKLWVLKFKLLCLKSSGKLHDR